MLKMRLILLVFCSLMQGSAYSGDLCLLTIDGYEQLEAVRQTVDHAHGIIADKFIVYVNTDQYRSLKGAGVDVKLLVKDCRLEDFYLVLAETERSPKTALELAPLYSAADSRIVKLQKSSTGILAREGYVVLPLIEKNTPFFYTQAHSYNPALIDYPTDSIADMVSLDSLYSYLTRLQGFYTRFTPTDSCDAARDWIRNKFQSFGYSDVTLQHFLATREDMNVFDEPTSNVICRKIGTEQPDKWIIIGGHYDSFADGCYTYLYAPAPGADCNASGTSAVLELARVFKDIEFSKSLMFVTFGGEEQWMDGSEYMAQQMYEDSIDIEFMLNFDIIGYEANGIPEFWIAATTNWAYGQVFVDAASRINDLLPIQIDSWLSDEASFTDRGYNAVAVWEHEIHPQMHTIYDNSTSIDFGYMTKFVEMSAAAVPVVDRSAAPTVCRLLDVGDGQSLRAVWDSCYADYSYKVAYDVKPSDFADTVDVPPLSCFHDITGLTEGVEYYATVLGMPGEGYPPFLYVVSQMTPLSIPRTPAEFTAEPDFQSVALSWKPNTELDLNHYKLLRKPIGFGWVVVDDGCTDTTFADTDVIGHQQYVYAVLAVDNDLNESDTAWSDILIPATLDGGILLVDETQSGGYNPTTQEQTAFFESIFTGQPYTRIQVDEAVDVVSRSLVGQYNPIFWMDDDDTVHVLEESLDTLDWFLSYDTDFFLTGWQTIYAITGQRHFYPGSFYYDNLGITYIAQNPQTDFTGATGLNGWPDLEVRNHPFYMNRLPDIDIFTESAQAEVIYTFNSYSSHPFFADKPVGIALDTYHGKRVVLGFPLYWLTEASAQALITKVFEYFAEESVLYGDINGDWSVSILDVTYLINYLYKEGPPPEDMNNTDVDASCAVNLLDATYLINYLYKNGPEPLEGCVE